MFDDQVLFQPLDLTVPAEQIIKLVLPYCKLIQTNIDYVFACLILKS